MDYDVAIDGAPESVPGGTTLLLLHPSIGETDRVDTDFLHGGDDRFLVVSTRTTAREVEQKLDYYEVDEENAVILDALSVERGYSRRSAQDIHYAAGPDDVAGIVDHVEEFFSGDDGRLHLSSEVHDEETVEEFAALFDGTVRLEDEGNVSYEGPA
jgi:hypothetical protein